MSCGVERLQPVRQLVVEALVRERFRVVDDGSLDQRRGSLTVDDEGTPTGRTVLIEDGILKGYMQDRLNARLMGVAPTGNGRRASYLGPYRKASG